MAETNPITAGGKIKSSGPVAGQTILPWSAPVAITKDNVASLRPQLQEQFGDTYNHYFDSLAKGLNFNGGDNGGYHNNIPGKLAIDNNPNFYTAGLPKGFTAMQNADGNDPNKFIFKKGLPNDLTLNIYAHKNEQGQLVYEGQAVHKNESMLQGAAKALSIGAMLIPGLGQAIGAGLGLGGATANIAGNAILQGGISAVGSGGNIGATLKGAAVGGLGGSTGSIVSGLTTAGLNPVVASILGKGVVGAGTSAIKGGDPLTGAILGNIPGVNTGMTPLNNVLNSLIKQSIATKLTPQRQG